MIFGSGLDLLNFNFQAVAVKKILLDTGFIFFTIFLPFFPRSQGLTHGSYSSQMDDLQ